MPQPQRVLLTTPAHFEVRYAINPHMEGNAGSVDLERARAQWDAIRHAYRAIDVEDVVLEGAEDLPDMVFCANQTLPYAAARGGKRGVVLSRMHADERKDEVPHYARFFEDQGYEVNLLPDDVHGTFEGMGDALWHTRRRLLWGGYGFRTDRVAYEAISAMLDVPVLTLHLEDPDFYHLDTCLSILDEHTALIHAPAFDNEGLLLLRHMFNHLIDTPEDEARELFACNAHCPDGHHVLIQQGCRVTNDRLQAAGFVPVELDTSEFLKAGGSVFCMKQMIW